MNDDWTPEALFAHLHRASEAQIKAIDQQLELEAVLSQQKKEDVIHKVSLVITSMKSHRTNHGRSQSDTVLAWADELEKAINSL